uniref:Uncharacterized protein n=1 Tax=Plectus sambesii TaxID=2011161 RepID=A0A914X325_9BILA
MPRRGKTMHQDSFDCDGNPPDALRPSLNRFADDTSMLGFRYLHVRYKTWFRILWALLLAFFLGLTVYQVFSRISYYFIKNPLTTVRTYDTPTFLQFPTVLVCNKLQVKASAIARMNPQLLKVMAKMRGDDYSLVNNSKLSAELERFDHIDLLDIFRNAQQSVDDFILGCQYGKSASCTDYVRPVQTPHGLCFAISPNLTVERPGPETTLSLLLNLETYDVIPGWVPEPGVIVSIYSHDAPMTVFYGEGTHLSPGKIMTIPVNDIRKLTRHQTACGTMKLHYFPKSEYSRAACYWDVTYAAIEEHCGCTPLRSPALRNRYNRTEPRMKTDTIIANETKKDENICTLREEFDCVQVALEKPADPETDKRKFCPEDCDDVSYSTIIFGNPLDSASIASHLPSDWEEEKEKKLSAFQVAYDTLPNSLIPPVKDIKNLAKEVKIFINSAAEAFGVTEKVTNDVPCSMTDSYSSMERAIEDMNLEEGFWPDIATYVDSVIPAQLMTVAELLDYDLVHAESHEVEDKDVMQQIKKGLYELDAVETSLSTPETLSGLKNLQPDMQMKLIKTVRGIIYDLRKCIEEMKLNSEELEYRKEKCHNILENQYRILHNARSIASFLSSISIASDYEKIALELISIIRKAMFKDVPELIEWTDYSIHLKQFEAQYKDGASENQKLHDLLKSRKLIQIESIEQVSLLSSRLSGALAAREKFLITTKIAPIANDSALVLKEANNCFLHLKSQLEILKKSHFLKAEWMSRLQRQVVIAQSYSNGPQYDQ